MLVHAYNCTRNNVTDFIPYYLMFGRKSCLPIDIPFGTNTAELKGSTSIESVENHTSELGTHEVIAAGVVPVMFRT